MVRDARRYRGSGLDRLEKQPTDLRRKTRHFGARTHQQVVDELDRGLCAEYVKTI